MMPNNKSNSVNKINTCAKVCVIDVDNLQSWVRFVLGQLKERTRKTVFAKREFCGSTWIYRGQRNADWQITSTFQREMKLNHAIVRNAERDLRGKEQAAIGNFKAKAWQYVPKQGMTKLEWLTLMRHHGVPTRLVDFTESPAIALFFAMEKDPQTDFAIWALNRDSMEDAYTQSLIGTKLPGWEDLVAKYGDKASNALNDTNSTDPIVIKAQNHCDNLALSEATVEMRNCFNRNLAENIVNAPLSKEADILKNVGAIWFYPEMPTSRMRAQRGLFLMPLTIATPFMDALSVSLGLSTSDMTENVSHICISDIDKLSRRIVDTKLIKFVFKKELINEAQDLLLFANCTCDNLYPDIEGVADSIKAQLKESLSDYTIVRLPN